MVTEVKDEMKVTLTKPISLDEDSDIYQPPNLVRRILSLFKNLRPGSDLANFQLPPMLNMPKSQLQCFGETVYSVSEDVLKECNNGPNAMERFKRVVGWAISTTRPVTFGVAPFNPVLGETHHVSSGSLHLLLEQVSHHPPVSALHATDDQQNLEMIWCQSPVPRFYGSKVEVEVKGKRVVKLKNHGETYEMNSPKMLIRIIPPGVDWIGNVEIKCLESGLEAHLCFSSSSLFFGRRGSHFVHGQMYHSSSSNNPLYELYGHWDSIVTLKDTSNGKESVLYNAKQVLRGLKTPIVKDIQGIWESESALVWSGASEAIMKKDWEKAKEAKKAVEDKQRELTKERNSKAEKWLPKHFVVNSSKDGIWDCSPIENSVPPAPIVVPLSFI